MKPEETNGNKEKEVVEVAENEGASRDPELLPDEQCCCGFLQRFASPYIFGTLACSINFFQAAASTGTGGGVLSTIEKRFQIKTSELAPFLIVNDIISVIMVLFVAYYGHTGHRPRIIGGGSLLIGIGLLLCTLPQFVYETPSQFSLDNGRDGNGSAYEQTVYQICTVNNATTPPCTEDEEKGSGSLLWQASFIIVGQILVGFGAAPLLPLAITYMDDALDRTSTSVYVACSFIATSLGPLLGFGVSSISLTTHADFYKGPVSAQPDDPNWLGAWWLTYAVTGLPILLLGLPICLFPKSMNRRPMKREESQKEALDAFGGEGEARGAEDTEESGHLARMYRLGAHRPGQATFAYIKGFLSAVRRLVTNMAFISLVLGICSLLASLYGRLVFMAKYLEVEFSLSASTAPLLFAVMLTPGALFGSLIGGYVVKKMKLTKKGMARMMVIIKPFSFLLAPMLLFLGCYNLDIAGITMAYPSMNTTMGPPLSLDVDCNAHCACPSDYTPICGSDGITYATPCHAGCQETVNGKLQGDPDENITIYSECSCIGASSQPNQLGLIGDYEHVATSGECLGSCATLIPYVASIMVVTLLNNILSNPGFMLQLRLVEDDDRSVAVGFTTMLLRLLAFIPSPIYFGAAIQQTCLLLQSSCGKTGNCLVYDIVNFRYTFNGLLIGLEVLALILFIVCYFLVKETKLPEQDSINQKDEEGLSDHSGVTGNQKTKMASSDTHV